MVLFHQEQGLPWLWLPTPSGWMTELHAKETDEQATLRRLQVMPASPQPDGLCWHAWDTRNNVWIQDNDLLARWYAHWLEAQQTLP